VTRGRVAAAAALAAVMGVVASTAHAATVTGTGDAGAGTLREAVTSATAGETIDFLPGLGAVVLSSTIDVGTPVTIQDSQADVEVRGTANPLLRFVSGSGGSTVRGVSLVRAGGTAVAVAGGVGPVAVRAAPEMHGAPALVLGVGANGGLPAPGDLRVVRGRSGGLVVVGTAASAGALDVYRGAPSDGSGAAFAAEIPVPAGPFAGALGITAAPEDALSATLSGAAGTSAFASVRVSGDLTPPRVLGAVAISQTEVRAQLSEPVDPATVAPGDFALAMAGAARGLAGAVAGPDGATVVLTAPRAWRAGEAGTLALREAGALSDVTGNESGAPESVRVLAAPGDVLEPLASSLRVRPRALCLTRGRRCRREGTIVRFIASEQSRATFVVQRGNRRVGVRKYDARTGANAIRFDGRVRGRKLRQGTYRLLVYLEDAVGNETADPPLQRFSVRRTVGGRR
jgi:hypothetical protein